MNISTTPTAVNVSCLHNDRWECVGRVTMDRTCLISTFTSHSVFHTEAEDLAWDPSLCTFIASRLLFQMRLRKFTT